MASLGMSYQFIDAILDHSTLKMTMEATSPSMNNLTSPNDELGRVPPRCVTQYEEATFIVYTVACSIALLGNLSFLIVVIKLKSMRTIPNLLFINLSMADTLFNVYTVIYLVSKKMIVDPLLNFHIKGGHAITDAAFCVSMITVALISLSRFIAICHPFKAEQMKLRSSPRIAVSMGFSWAYGIAVALFDFLIYSTSEDPEKTSLFAILLALLVSPILLSITIAVVCYVLIARKMMSTRPQYSPGPNAHSCISDENQVLFLCIFITVVFFISCSPLAAIYIIVTFSRVLGYIPITPEELSCLAFAAKIMITLHFTLNPILYNVGSKNHRLAFRKPLLGYPDFKKPCTLVTDASKDGLGAVLYQRQDGKLVVIGYRSRTLTTAEQNYHMHSGKLKFLALKWGVTEKFRDYLSFIVYTDNNQYVLTTAKLNATGHRWVADLADFYYMIKYRPGRSNTDADVLSRMPVDVAKYEQSKLQSNQPMLSRMDQLTGRMQLLCLIMFRKTVWEVQH
ncbi:neuropeptide Y receptor type 2-like [Saccoglossus kowalevskii]